MSDPDGHALRAELVDEITEAVVKPTDARVRAQVITELVHEVDEAVKWRHQQDPDGQEERSLAPLVEAAAAHQERMETLGDVGDREEDPEHPRGTPQRSGGSTAI